MDRRLRRRNDGAEADDLLALHSSRGRIALVGSVLASATAMLDATVANVALPEIADDLGTDLSGVRWVITSYLLTLASLILLGGALGDRFGRRRMFVVGAAWFGSASLLCALAPTLVWLIVGRLLQGCGAAILTPVSLALLQVSFTEEDRGAAVGAWSGLGGLAAALGPLVGGWLVGGPGWRWAFAANAPLLLVAIGAAMAFGDRPPRATGRSFDVLGALLAAGCLAALTWALTESARRGLTDPLIGTAILFSAVSAGVFVARDRRSDSPLVPPSLFGSRTFTVLNAMTFTLYAALGAEFFLTVYQLQLGAGWGPLAAGSAMLPATLLMLVGSERSGALATRIGPRLQLVTGPALVALGFVALVRIDENTSWVTDVLPGSLLFGLGTVCFVAPLTAAVMGSVDQHFVTTASGVNNAIARTGGLIAIAVIPNLVGLPMAASGAEITAAYRRALLTIAGLALMSSVIAFAGLRQPRLGPGVRRSHRAVGGPPVRPDHSPCAERRQ